MVSEINIQAAIVDNAGLPKAACANRTKSSHLSGNPDPESIRANNVIFKILL